MPADEVQCWLNSSKPARVAGLLLWPHPHPLVKGMPMSIQRGQAEAFFLVDDTGQCWICKKFLAGRCPDAAYLTAVTGLLPRHEGFRAGTARRLLTTGDLDRRPGKYSDCKLAAWLEGTLLMPRIEGVDWSSLADEIREGHVQLTPEHRLGLCRHVAELVQLLEQAQCSHRDISCGNAFIDLGTGAVYFIDFDSLYHPNLSIPAVTTCGTAGYTAPWSWRNGNLDALTTWVPRADRFAMAILCAEFLLVEPGTVLTGEGGAFSQDELRVGQGPGLKAAVEQLKRTFPGAASLLIATIQAGRFDDCPSPADWLRFTDATGFHQPPQLQELDGFTTTDFEKALTRRRPPAILWPPPKLSDLPLPSPLARRPQPFIVTLPANPWTP
jgi:hypothetical protein